MNASASASEYWTLAGATLVSTKRTVASGPNAASKIKPAKESTAVVTINATGIANVAQPTGW
jgi:hypothetical protein